MVLEFYDTAVISSISQPLHLHLTQYLRYLQDEGHNLLYTLPHFKRTFPFSPSTPSIYSLGPVPDIDVASIDARLRIAWIKACLVALNLSCEHVRPTTESICLTEYSSEDCDTRFEVKVGIPKVYLCGDQVYLRITVTEGNFYVTRGIAPDVVQRVDGSFDIKINVLSHTKLELSFAVDDIKSGLETCFHPLSHSCGQHINSFLETFPLAYHSAISKAMTDADERAPRFDLEACGTIVKGAPSPGLATTHDLHSFDFVQIFDHDSLSQQFRSLHEADGRSTSQWTRCSADGKTFNANFGPIRARFLSDDKVVVWIRPKEFSGSVLASSYVLNDLSLAFEVPIKMSEEMCPSNGTPSSASNPDRSEIIQHHVCLDLQNAELVVNLCNLGELVDHAETVDLQTIGSSISEMWASYSKQLVDKSHHVLLTIPVCKAGACSTDDILSSVKAFTCSKTKLTRYTVDKHSAKGEAALIVVGMCGYRPFPFDPSKLFIEWIPDGGSKNSLFISRRYFLEGRILRFFSSINDRLAGIAFGSAPGGSWNRALLTLLEAPESGVPCFKVDGTKLHIEWMLCKEEKMTETYDLCCQIINKLSIEIGTPNIQMSGTFSIKSAPVGNTGVEYVAWPVLLCVRLNYTSQYGDARYVEHQPDLFHGEWLPFGQIRRLLAQSVFFERAVCTHASGGAEGSSNL
ncbi:hypothetical protein OE88DRAFT_371839 [Heliocybe sulcata]|uniref:Uncharacterized protein n=1 Tax=Heliocybe sulcata TaxID=5364 RepID=A0A5C3MXR4_9AGAM|nr:hypothetical protein OE88DRAFT_371839 [Heliocybe sulcata]